MSAANRVCRRAQSATPILAVDWVSRWIGCGRSFSSYGCSPPIDDMRTHRLDSERNTDRFVASFQVLHPLDQSTANLAALTSIPLLAPSEPALSKLRRWAVTIAWSTAVAVFGDSTAVLEMIKVHPRVRLVVVIVVGAHLAGARVVHIVFALASDV